MRVYGSVMWALGKVLRGVPEVPKLVVGSFWDAEMPFEEEDEVDGGMEGDLNGNGGRHGSCFVRMEWVS